jgi:ribonuclease Z
VAVVLVILAGLLLTQKQIGLAVVDRLANRIMTANAVTGLPDGLHVALVGSGAPFADPRRAGPSTAVIVGKNIYIVDTGPGAVRKLELMKFKPEDVKAVFLTHFHSDHIGDLGELMLKRWAGGSMDSPLDVFGPVGVDTVVRGFNLAYSLDSQYRVLHHGPDVVPPSGAGGAARPFRFPDGKEVMVVHEVDGLTVTAFEVDHAPVKPAVGYRFDYKGRSVVISGDTVPCPSLTRQSRGVDLLVQEVLQPVMVGILKTTGNQMNRPKMAAIMGDILRYHTTPEDAAKLASEAGAGHLLLSHILPPLPVADLKPAFLGDAGQYFRGPITIGEDGMLFSLPAGSKKIMKKWLL